MEGNLSESPLLIAQNGPLKGQRWTINKPLLVGRETTCEIMVPDRMVSRFHARITPTPEGMLLEDLDSKNGTHCNGNPVTGRFTCRMAIQFKLRWHNNSYISHLMRLSL